MPSQVTACTARSMAGSSTRRVFVKRSLTVTPLFPATPRSSRSRAWRPMAKLFSGSFVKSCIPCLSFKFRTIVPDPIQSRHCSSSSCAHRLRRYDAEGREPFWYPPDLPHINNGDWRLCGETSHILNCHIEACGAKTIIAVHAYPVLLSRRSPRMPPMFLIWNICMARS